MQGSAVFSGETESFRDYMHSVSRQLVSVPGRVLVVADAVSGTAAVADI